MPDKTLEPGGGDRSISRDGDGPPTRREKLRTFALPPPPPPPPPTLLHPDDKTVLRVVFAIFVIGLLAVIALLLFRQDSGADENYLGYDHDEWFMCMNRNIHSNLAGEGDVDDCGPDPDK